MKLYEVRTLINSLIKNRKGYFRTETQAMKLGNIIFDNQGNLGNDYYAEFDTKGITKVKRNNVIVFERI